MDEADRSLHSTAGTRPLVSVVIPFLDPPVAFLGEAVDSVLAQDFPHFEVIVVNDGSTDNTAAVLSGYGEAIRVVESMPRWIPGKQRNVPVRVRFNMPIRFILL